MTFQLRYYQREAIDSVYEFWGAGGYNPLIELATGTGKSGVAGTFCKELVQGYPDLRIGVLAHRKELIRQNAEEMFGIWPNAPLGIYSAGLGRRDMRAQILFAGIQSIHKKAEALKGFDLLLVDEAHLIPRASDTMYGRFINDCREIIPDMRIVGLTATPYRLGTGRLDQGMGRIFDKITYSYGIGRGVEDGYLCPLTAKKTHSEIDVSGVGKRGGEFIESELQEAILDQRATVKMACEETAYFMHEEKRRKLLAFCAGVAHARLCAEFLTEFGVPCTAVTGDMQGDRDAAIKRFTETHSPLPRALSGVDILTTGFNDKAIDMIAMYRSTLSTGLYVQMLGRGTRVLYAPGFNMDDAEGRRAAIQASDKPNCRIMCFAGNVRRHGPVDDLAPVGERSEKGKTKESPTEIEKITVETVKAKECPNCGELLPLTASECDDCGYVYPVTASHDAKADQEAAVMKCEQVPEWRDVENVFFKRHEKQGGTPSMRVDYFCSQKIYSEWLCFEHEGFARTKAEKAWDEMCGDTPPPANVDEAIARADELMHPSRILVHKDGQYWRIVAKNFAKSNAPVESWKEELDDEIPF